MALQAELQKYEQLDCGLVHTFAPGAYARSIFLPKGAVIIGKIHKHAHLNIVSMGKVLVVTEFDRVTLEGPCTFTSEAGTKRALVVLEDTVWTTIHLTNETDLIKIEADIISPSYDELPDSIIAQCAKLITAEKLQ